MPSDLGGRRRGIFRWRREYHPGSWSAYEASVDMIYVANISGVRIDAHSLDEFDGKTFAQSCSSSRARFSSSDARSCSEIVPLPVA